MSHRSELLRRKDTCVECLIFKPIKAKDMCQNCWHKFKRKNNKRFFLRTRYTEIRQRCTNENRPDHMKYYKGKLNCTLEDFYNKFIDDPIFNKLFDNWRDNNHIYTLVPSIDRINVNLDYSLDNMQFLEHGLNCSKDNKTKIKVKVYTKDGIFINEYDSLNKACIELNLIQANAWKVLHGERNTVSGYRILYA